MRGNDISCSFSRESYKKTRRLQSTCVYPHIGLSKRFGLKLTWKTLSLFHCNVIPLTINSQKGKEKKTRNKPSAKGTTINALSTKTVLVRCWDTPTDSGSWNFTKHTRDVTGIGESLQGKVRLKCYIMWQYDYIMWPKTLQQCSTECIFVMRLFTLKIVGTT